MLLVLEHVHGQIGPTRAIRAHDPNDGAVETRDALAWYSCRMSETMTRVIDAGSVAMSARSRSAVA
jgi:hypothetical protein